MTDAAVPQIDGCEGSAVEVGERREIVDPAPLRELLACRERMPKAAAAARRLESINSQIAIQAEVTDVTAADVVGLIGAAGSDEQWVARPRSERTGVMTNVANTEIWNKIREEAGRDAQQEPALASYLYTVVLNHTHLEDALSYILASKLGSPTVTGLTLRDLIDAVFTSDPAIETAIHADLQAVVTRDPVCRGYSVPLLYFKGFHALSTTPPALSSARPPLSKTTSRCCTR